MRILYLPILFNFYVTWFGYFFPNYFFLLFGYFNQCVCACIRSVIYTYIFLSLTFKQMEVYNSFVTSRY